MPGNKTVFFSAVIVTVSLALAALAFAGVPQTINYQGYLNNGSGVSVSGPISMTFSLYSSATPRNNPVWRESAKPVVVTNGIYSTQLGSATPITAPFDLPYKLGVLVGADPTEMLQPLTSSAYAFRAGVADSVNTNATLSGNTLAQLDSRYSNPTQPRATPQQIATLRWDQAGGANGAYSVGSNPYALAYDGSSIWVANVNSSNVVKINPATGAVVATITVGVGPRALAYDGASIWVANNGSNNVMKINPATGAVAATITVGSGPTALAFDGASIWVTNYGSSNVMRINPATGAVAATITVGTSPLALAYDGSSIWVANNGSNNVMRINPATGAVAAPITVGISPVALAFDGSSIWVANYTSNSVTKLSATALPVGVQQVTTSDIADGAVTSTKIAAGAVTSSAIAAGAVRSTQLAAGSVTSSAIAVPLGIGTTTPGFTLDVNGTGRVKSNFDIASAVAQIGFNRNSTNGQIYDTASKAWQMGSLGAASNDDFVISSWNTNQSALATVLRLTTAGAATFAGTVTANGSLLTSDRRLKTDIQPLEGTLDKVLNLRGVSYVMKADDKKERKIGVIAQELEQEYPELVATDDQGMKSVAYANLTAVLIEAVKGLKAENEALKLRLERLENAHNGQ